MQEKRKHLNMCSMTSGHNRSFKQDYLSFKVNGTKCQYLLINELKLHIRSKNTAFPQAELLKLINSSSSTVSNKHDVIHENDVTQ